MKNRFMKICSILLVMVLLFNMLPHRVLADMLSGEEPSLTPGSIAAGGLSNLSEIKDASIPIQEADIQEAVVIGELTGKRTEYTKEFRLSNGLHMAVVYPDAVHYEADNGWEEIDNTLTAKADGTIVNTAGIWDISFPQQLSAGEYVTVTKDGYTLRFGMGGVLSDSGTAVMRAGNTFSVQNAQSSVAQVQQLDTTTQLAKAKHPETVATKLNARLQYSNIYSNTNVVYDLQSNKLKESVVINRYDSSLRGYRYTLDVGNLVPVLQDDNSIHFYDASKKNAVMTMPAPFMVDADKVYSYDVDVILQGSGSSYTLQYLLPQQWLAEENRAWPVVLDPVVTPALSTSNIRDRSVTENWNPSQTWGYNACGYFVPEGIVRFFLKYQELPVLTSSDVIVNATIQMYKDAGTDTTIPVNVHKVNGMWESESITWSNKPSYDTNIEDFAVVNTDAWYGWVITDIVRDWYANENTGMMFKASDEVESGGVGNYKQFLSSDYGTELSRPLLSITFRNNNGLEDYWNYTTSSAGRAGTGYVNNYTGNLVWVRNDMGFGGNRMPVAISHIYNLNDVIGSTDGNSTTATNGNVFGLGNGWRTNFNQRIFQWQVNPNYYRWEDSDGTDHYFLYESPGVYKDEDGLELTLTNTGSGNEKYCITDKYGNRSYFDIYGRLTKLSNNQATKSHITISYDGQSYRISTITDGVGRVYIFSYGDNLLMHITCSSAYGYVYFSYNSNGMLTQITDEDGKSSIYTYTANGVLTSIQDIDGYTLTYAYDVPTHSWQPYRVQSVSESDYVYMEEEPVQGGTLTFAYDHNQTTVTDHNSNVQIMQFNNWGNMTAIQDDEGRAQYVKYAKDINPDVGKNNQIRVASKLQNTVANILPDNSFELGTTWTGSDATVSTATDTAYYGSKALKIVTSGAGSAQSTFTAEAGKTYTFSAYIKTGSSGAYLNVGNTVSETLPANKDWTRLEASYTNNTTSPQSITIRIINATAGTTYVDCVQLELAATASRYNLITNGDFRNTTAWSSSNGRTTTAAAAPQLSTNVYSLTGTFTSENRISQTVNVSGSAEDSFIIAGWAKGNATPGSDYSANNREFALHLQFNYTDNTSSDPISAQFNPDSNQWQYAAVPAVAEKAYSSVTVYLVYDYNANTVYFDGIQLFKEEFGTSYAYDDNGNATTVVDLQKQTTTQEYDANNLTAVIQNDQVKMTYTYDDYHNVLTATTIEGLVYNFTYDTYGNNTSVSITSNGVTMSSYATYSDDGNRLVSTTDALGNTTLYDYDAGTNVLNSVQYPEDTEETRTTYTYDVMYRVMGSEVTADTGTPLYAFYSYSGDYLTGISTGTTEYSIEYNDLFGLRQRIHIDESPIVFYYYTDDENHYLSGIDFCNGSEVYYDYDKKGRLTKETYTNGDTVDYSYNNNGDLARTVDSQSGITTSYYYDLTDRMMKYVESGANYSHSVGYTYDALNNLTSLVENINGTDHTTTYTYDEDNRIISSTTDGITVTYTYDAFGRVSTQTTKNGSTVILTESFTYKAPTSTSVSAQIDTYTTTAANGYSVTYSYTYDDNGNILSISDGTYTTTYEYDSLNQLIRENNQAGGFTYLWVYDNGGNIQNRFEYAYTLDELELDMGIVPMVTPLDTVYYGYMEGTDVLIRYDGKRIESSLTGIYNYDGWTYMTDHGTRLMAMWNDETGEERYFTYNADGMRTKRTEPNGTTYHYVYNGGSLSQMTVGGNSLYFTYDANGTPLTVTYNGTTYYYATNLQGDITAILNSAGTAVVSYTYDAWGNILSVTGTEKDTLGLHNPLRYRGYVYDVETKLYYLQSRYYNPTWGRFISADAYISTGQGVLGYNMFAYCLNNPVNCADYGGNLCCLIKQPLVWFVEIPRTIFEFFSRYLMPDEEEKVLIATIAAEATVTANGKPVSSEARQAMANVALNRVGLREWSNYKSVSEICAYTHFDGYNTRDYHACMNYLNNRDFSNTTYESIIWDVSKAYLYDITNGCQLYYTPAAMDPPGSLPYWNFSILTEVNIPNVDTYYEGRFFKYS